MNAIERAFTKLATRNRRPKQHGEDTPDWQSALEQQSADPLAQQLRDAVGASPGRVGKSPSSVPMVPVGFFAFRTHLPAAVTTASIGAASPGSRQKNPTDEPIRKQPEVAESKPTVVSPAALAAAQHISGALKNAGLFRDPLDSQPVASPPEMDDPPAKELTGTERSENDVAERRENNVAEGSDSNVAEQSENEDVRAQRIQVPAAKPPIVREVQTAKNSPKSAPTFEAEEESSLDRHIESAHAAIPKPHFPPPLYRGPVEGEPETVNPPSAADATSAAQPAPAEFQPDWEVDRLEWPTAVRRLCRHADGDFAALAEDLMALKQSDPLVVTFAGEHDAVGCSTTVMCVARMLAKQGQRVLLIDAQSSVPNAATADSVGADLGVELEQGWNGLDSGGNDFAKQLAACSVRSVDQGIDFIHRQGDVPVQLALLRRVVDTAAVARDVTLIDFGAHLPADSSKGTGEPSAWNHILIRDARPDSESAAAFDEASHRQSAEQAGLTLLGVIENFASEESSTESEEGIRSTEDAKMAA